MLDGQGAKKSALSKVSWTTTLEPIESNAHNRSSTLSIGVRERLRAICEEKNILQKSKEQMLQKRKEAWELENKLHWGKSGSKVSGNSTSRPEEIRTTDTELRVRILRISGEVGWLEGRIQIHENNIQFLVDQLIRKLLEDLNETDLPHESDAQSDGASIHVIDQAGANVDSVAFHETTSASLATGHSEALRRATAEELCEARERLEYVQDRFDRKTHIYTNDRHKFAKLLAEGAAAWSMTFFDNRHLLSKRQVTRRLIEAEEYFEGVQMRARDLGVLPSTEHLELTMYASEEGDKQRKIQDHPVLASWDRERIEVWRARIMEEDHPESAVWETAVDEWDARPVEISDTISMIDHSNNRRRIDQWRASCDGIGAQ